NPRLIGGTGPRMLWHGCGINIYELLIAIFLGQPPASPPAWHTAVTSRFLGCAVPSVMPHFDIAAWQYGQGDGLAECVMYRDAGECLPALHWRGSRRPLQRQSRWSLPLNAAVRLGRGAPR
ncbi:MAG: hypothetical protein HYV02_05070, partial [Deltaproteobacteria bacterium]|nr:hypothetical protein [Deltaproteobacteria bacterium]